MTEIITSDIKSITGAIKLPLNVMSLPGFTEYKSLVHLNVRRFSFGNALSDFILANVEKAAKQFSANTGGGEVRIHTPKGPIRDSDTIAPGHDPNPPHDKKH